MRETANVDFKSEVNSSFLKTVSAFANGSGGEIRFGLADDGVCVGLSNPIQDALDIENRINDSITPRPMYSIRADEGDSCVILEVSSGPDRPYFYKAKAYVRRDSSTIEADQFELRRMILESSNLSFDGMPALSETLRFSVLSARLREALSIEQVGDGILKTLGLMRPDGSFTNAGAILADENGFVGVDIARFGDSINVILDRDSIDGKSVLVQYDRAVEFFRRYFTYEKIEGFTRTKHERIPEAAFREALANALVHRRWDINARVRIEMHEDRIEITSPGGLMTGLSEEEYLRGDVSLLRNPSLAGVFFRLGMIENFGTGIRRIRALYEETDVKPRFRINSNSVVIILPVTDEMRLPEGDEGAVLATMASGNSYTSGQLAEATGFGKDKVLRILADLIGASLVEKSGSGRGVRYRRL